MVSGLIVTRSRGGPRRRGADAARRAPAGGAGRELLAWLASEENTHVCGQTIYIDGGSDVGCAGTTCGRGTTPRSPRRLLLRRCFRLTALPGGGCPAPFEQLPVDNSSGESEVLASVSVRADEGRPGRDAWSDARSGCRPAGCGGALRSRWRVVGLVAAVGCWPGASRRRHRRHDEPVAVGDQRVAEPRASSPSPSASASVDIPAAAREKSDKGAEAFVRYFFDQVNSRLDHPEPDLIEATATEKCSTSCARPRQDCGEL